MTDKAKAERFREDLVCSTSRYVGKDNYEYIEQAYLAGLHEGQKTKWHDLRKDPNDLPKECRMYFVYKIDGYGAVSMEIMQFNNKHCWSANCQSDVIAWCEIPQFKE